MLSLAREAALAQHRADLCDRIVRDALTDEQCDLVNELSDRELEATILSMRADREDLIRAIIWGVGPDLAPTIRLIADEFVQRREPPVVHIRRS